LGVEPISSRGKNPSKGRACPENGLKYIKEEAKVTATVFFYVLISCHQLYQSRDLVNVWRWKEISAT
jgi:hypothetical protein